MKLRVDTEPEIGSAYEDLRAFACLAEELGFDGFFCADHYMTPSTRSTAPPGPLDAWTTLAGLARDTRRIRIGSLVSPVTFRLPGQLAVIAAQVDAMSGGRVELGLGAAHFEGEHRAYGIPWPERAERFDRLEEQLAIITGLWATPPGESFTFHGRHYTLEDCPALPKPVQRPRLPVIVGGRGPQRTPRLVARFADEYNISYLGPEDTAAAMARAREACEEIGRDPAGLRFSVTQLLCCGADAGELRRRQDFLADHADDQLTQYPTRERVAGFAAVGTPDTVVEHLMAYHALGVAYVYLHCFDHSDHDHLRLVAAEVLPKLV
jgi:F420-dependent oxidoreductase-like protein